MGGQDIGKRHAARAALELVQSGMTLGLGTGSTAAHFIRGLAEMVGAGLDVVCVATSRASEQLALEGGIPMLTLDRAQRLDLTVDGADEVDPALNLIKGGGAALLREKIVAYHSDRLVIVADNLKDVPCLGAFPLPVEVVPFWWQATRAALERLDVTPQLRCRPDGEPIKTDNHNLILDCPFGEIHDPAQLEAEILMIPGVVEVGLFVQMAEMVLLGHPDGSLTRRGVID